MNRNITLLVLHTMYDTYDLSENLFVLHMYSKPLYTLTIVFHSLNSLMYFALHLFTVTIYYDI